MKFSYMNEVILFFVTYIMNKRFLQQLFYRMLHLQNIGLLYRTSLRYCRDPDPYITPG
jgi:hypothetical protein